MRRLTIAQAGIPAACGVAAFVALCVLAGSGPEPAVSGEPDVARPVETTDAGAGTEAGAVPAATSSAEAVPAGAPHEPAAAGVPENNEQPAASAEVRGVPAESKTVMTTLFWVGEGADESNDFISNHESYWDEDWLMHYGGADSPSDRCGYAPCAFAPKENPFYFALPYGEFDRAGRLKASAKTIPWYAGPNDLLLKNRWIAVTHDGKTCYAQWEDVGPNEEDDFSYVFGSSSSLKNTFGVAAGLDISPATWDCLGMTDNAMTSWRFVTAAEVPSGPWKETVTVSGATW